MESLTEKDLRLDIVIFGKPEKALQIHDEIPCPWHGQKIQENPPGVPRLHRPIFGVLLLGIFRRRFQNDIAKPSLNQEGINIEIILLLLAEPLRPPVSS